MGVWKAILLKLTIFKSNWLFKSKLTIFNAFLGLLWLTSNMTLKNFQAKLLLVMSHWVKFEELKGLVTCCFGPKIKGKKERKKEEERKRKVLKEKFWLWFLLFCLSQTFEGDQIKFFSFPWKFTSSSSTHLIARA